MADVIHDPECVRQSGDRMVTLEFIIKRTDCCGDDPLNRGRVGTRVMTSVPFPDVPAVWDQVFKNVEKVLRPALKGLVGMGPLAKEQ